jgi:hypothetical protein
MNIRKNGRTNERREYLKEGRRGKTLSEERK